MADTPDIGSFGVSRETEVELAALKDLVLRWNQRINLIGPTTEDGFDRRHLADSIQVYRLAPDFTKWVDIGTGGGFPGLVAAALAKKSRPDARFVLIESDSRKAAFLQTAVHHLHLNAEVQSHRAESCKQQAAEIVSARAVGPLTRLLPLVCRHLAPHGTALLPKGQNWQTEIEDVRQRFQFTAEAVPSMTDPRARILVVRDIVPITSQASAAS
jgi:16S rRNA (guanine527-N7)-methyltransferase